MKKIIFTIAVAAISFAATAQTTDELLQFSRHNFGISTARSAGMGGAFTSLGSDASSMSINPAGLAMYSQSEIVVSPGLKIGSSTSRGFDYDGAQINSNFRNQVRATINNFAAVYAGENWAVGVAYNRLGDFNGSSYTAGGYGGLSMADVFVNQLQGTRSGSIGSNSSSYGFNHNPVMWPAILGYQTYMVTPLTDNESNTAYNLHGVLEGFDLVSSTYSTNTSGGIDEFAFSGAWNYNDVLYIGATLGVQSIYRTQSTVYREFAAINDDGTPYNAGAFDAMDLRQSTTQSGVGVNVKLGVTVRPTPWFRVAVAYHSPTWTTMNEVTTMNMYSSFRAQKGGYIDYDSYTPDLIQDYGMRSPSRLLAGLSFTIAKRIIISADYEMAWYNDMKYTTTLNTFGWRAPTNAAYIDNLPTYVNYTNKNGNIDINSMISDHYRPTSNYRIGIEARPLDQLFLRAGFGYSESPYKNPEGIEPGFDKPSNYGSYTQYSGGIGYRSRNFNIDLTYVYGTTNTLPSTYFDYITDSGDEIISDYSTKQKVENHNIILSFAWRF